MWHSQHWNHFGFLNKLFSLPRHTPAHKLPWCILYNAPIQISHTDKWFEPVVKRTWWCLDIFRFPKCLLYVQTININCQIIFLCEHLFPGSYNFIRLSRRVLCYCSSGFQISTMLTVPDPECNVKCKGNIRQYCGGNGGDYFVYSAFEVYTPGKYSLHNEHRIQVR